MMDKLSLAGRLQSSINYQGTIPEQDSVSVQCGGMGAIRLFTKDPQETFSWFDRLCWTMPDIEDEQLATQQYRFLNSSARQEFPAGKIPILVEKMSETLYAEFPRMAMKHFCDTIRKPNMFDHFLKPETAKSKNPLDAYIVSNFIAPLRLMFGMFEFFDDGSRPGEAREAETKWKSHWEIEDASNSANLPPRGGRLVLEYPPVLALSAQEPFKGEPGRAHNLNFAVIYMNVGLLSWDDAKKILLYLHHEGNLVGIKAFIRRMDNLNDRQRASILGISEQMLNGQYQCFSYLRNHNFGKALSVGNHGDGLRVLFNI
jgi:hypothetical protein